MLPTLSTVDESQGTDRLVAVRRAGAPGDAAPLRAELLASIPRTARGTEDPIPSRASARTALYYTRFSTTGQSALSTERQIEDCRTYSKLAGLQLAPDGIYSDEARSGFYITGRDRLDAMLKRVREERISCVIIAHTSRLARDMVDLGWLYRQLKHLDVELHAVGSGKLNAAMIAMHGFLNQEQIETLVHNTRFARRAMVKDGRVPWGARTFGYVKDGPKGGQVKRDPEEEVIVRDIFNLAKAGVAHASIAKILNDEGRLGRRKRPWTADAIGSMLRNPQYRGIIVYCRFRHQRKPDSPTVEVIPVPEDDWEVAYAEHLKIIDGALWDEVQAKACPSHRNKGTRHGPFLLSELVRCPSCGNEMVCMGAPGQGQERRFVCSSHIYNKSCENQRSWDMRWIEAGTLGLLADELDDASLYEPYFTTLNAKSKAVAAEVYRRRAELERRLADVKVALKATFDPMHTRNLEAEDVEELRTELSAERGRLREALARTGQPRAAVDVAARVAELCNLGAALRDLAQDVRFDMSSREGEMMAGAIRGMIRRIVPRPDPASHGVAIELHLSKLAFYRAVDAKDGPARVLTGVHVPLTKEEHRRRTALEKLQPYLADGRHQIDDATWATIRHLVPDDACRPLDGERRDGRSLVEALLLGLRAARPFADLPPVYGTRESLWRAAGILVRSGGWAKILALLGERGSSLVEGTDAHRFDYFQKLAVRRKRLAGGAPSRARRGEIVRLLARPEGATLAEVKAMTGQRPGAIRTAVSRLPRVGLLVTRIERPSGVKAWRTVPAGS
ncbi:recombinase family protein [Methylobacterium sp. D54C]